MKSFFNFKFFIYILSFFGFYFNILNSNFFDYDFAAYYGQQGKWQEAKEGFKKVSIDRPNDLNLMYDLGVSSFKTKDFAQAAVYFKSVCDSASASNSLKELANFNLGNTNFELKNLQDAVKNYEKTLELNPANEQAKHNLEVVKRLLQEQDKNKQDKNKQDENKNKEQEKKEKQDDKQGSEDKKSGKDSQDKRKEDQAGSSQEKNGDSDKQEKKSNHEDGSKQEKSSGQDGKPQEKDSDKQEKDKGAGGKSKELDKSDLGSRQDTQNSKKNNKESGAKEDGVTGKNGQAEKLQEKELDKSDLGSSQDTQNSDKNKQEKEGQQDMDKPLSATPVKAGEEKKFDKETEQVLKAVGEYDKEKSKQFMRATVKKGMAGQYGQNLW